MEAIKVGDKILMMGPLTASIEVAVKVTEWTVETRCLDVIVPSDTSKSQLRTWLLAQPNTRLHKVRLVMFYQPATINLSGNGEHTVIGVYHRP